MGLKSKAVFKESSKTTTKPLRIIHQNVRSLGNCTKELEVFLAEEGAIDFACVSEHWQTKEQLNLLNIKGFSLVASYCRDAGEHGGAAVFCRDSLVVKSNNKINSLSQKLVFECASAQFVSFSKTVVVICIYRSPTSCINLFFIN